MWTGPVPTIMITNPEHIKEVFSKTYDFEATVSSPLVKLLVGGLASYKGDKWERHRRIINPAFNLEKIKVLSLLSLVSESSFYCDPSSYLLLIGWTEHGPCVLPLFQRGCVPMGETRIVM